MLTCFEDTIGLMAADGLTLFFPASGTGLTGLTGDLEQLKSGKHLNRLYIHQNLYKLIPKRELLYRNI